MTYEKYIEGCNKFGVVSAYKNEDEFNRAVGIETDTCEPCFLSPKYTKLKACEPSLKEHEKRVRLS